MASWRLMHRRRRRKQMGDRTEPSWVPSGWEAIYGEILDDDDYDDGYDRAYEDDENSGDCFHCSGEGWIDGFENDPLWFEPGEMERCTSCGGSGRSKDMTIW